jgi:hypothetical protein
MIVRPTFHATRRELGDEGAWLYNLDGLLAYSFTKDVA